MTAVGRFSDDSTELTALLHVPDGIIASVIQRACDRCTRGVMDRDNPHLYGECTCRCHAAPRWTRAEVGEDVYAELTDTIDPGDDEQ